MHIEKTIRLEYSEYCPEPFEAQELVDAAAENVSMRLPDFDITAIHDDDEETLRLLCEGDTSSVLWCDDSEKQNYLRRLNPKNFNDFLVFSTLYMPSSSGTMAALERFIEWRWHPESIISADPSLDEILKPTCGVFVFYEQITQAIQIIAGYDPDHSDALRKYMCKEKMRELAFELEAFVSGAIGKGYSQGHAEVLFEYLHRHVKHCMKRSYSIHGKQTTCRSRKESRIRLRPCGKGRKGILPPRGYGQRANGQL